MAKGIMKWRKANGINAFGANTIIETVRSYILTSYESEINGKVRKYYSITKGGKKYLRSKKEEWQEYQTAVLSVLGAGA